MSGYYGYSMSQNAIAAYEMGERPKSKWLKADFTSANPLVKKLTLGECRNHFLSYSSWHHTSEFYNRTEFFTLDEDLLRNFTQEQVDEVIAGRVKKVKEAPRTIYAKANYLVWSGTRRHPSSRRCECYVKLLSTDKMVMTEHGRKRLTSVGLVEVSEEEYNAHLEARQKAFQTKREQELARWRKEWEQRHAHEIVDAIPDGYKLAFSITPDGYKTYCNGKTVNGKPIKGYKQVYVKEL